MLVVRKYAVCLAVLCLAMGCQGCAHDQKPTEEQKKAFLGDPNSPEFQARMKQYSPTGNPNQVPVKK